MSDLSGMTAEELVKAVLDDHYLYCGGDRNNLKASKAELLRRLQEGERDVARLDTLHRLENEGQVDLRAKMGCAEWVRKVALDVAADHVKGPRSTAREFLDALQEAMQEGESR